MKTSRLLGIAAAALLFVQCGSADKTADYSITKDGLGPLTFSAETVDFGKGYEVKSESFENEMDDYTETYVTVYKDAEEVAVMRDGSRIEVLSPDFKTADGLHAGMALSDALAILGEDIKIWNYRDDTYFYFAKPDSNISVIVDGDAVKGGFENYYLHPFDVTVEHFAPETEVKAVIIENE